MKGVEHAHSFHALFQAAVTIEQARFEVQYGFATVAEAKVPGFNDAGVNWADRHLQHTFSFDQQMRKFFGRLHWRTL